MKLQQQLEEKKKFVLQVAFLPRTATVRLRSRQIPECDFVPPDPLLIALNDSDSFILRPGDLRFSPATGSSAILVLHQKMGGMYLAFLRALVELARSRCAAVMLSHVCFQLLRVGFGRRLPSRLFAGRIEVVWKVFGIGMSNFPIGRKPGFGLDFPLVGNLSGTRWVGCMRLP